MIIKGGGGYCCIVVLIVIIKGGGGVGRDTPLGMEGRVFSAFFYREFVSRMYDYS